MSERLYTSCGKQVLCAGKDFAQANSDDEASHIAANMNVAEWLDEQADNCKQRATARAWRVAADNIRARLHEPENLQT